jgi:uncharacterized protein (TIGR02271 family)
MSRTVTALFDSRAEAEAARERLSQSSIDAERVRILDQSSSGSSGSGESGEGFWSSVKDAFMPDDDRHAYEEGMRRGGYLLCAQVDEDDTDRAISILEESDSVDFDQRQDSWRSEGWQPYSGTMGTTGGNMGTTGGTGTMGLAGTSPSLESDRTTGMTGRAEDRVVQEERIPIVQEQLHVGKREVNRGGARVRSYIRETPVHEQVNLREEHVSVERRPVDQVIAAGDNIGDADLLRERTVEMTETAEVPMVSKEARVAEELVVRKTAEERTEQVEDTVRHTEVDVDEDGRGTGERSALFGNDRDGGTSETSRTDYERTRTDGSF